MTDNKTTDTKAMAKTTEPKIVDITSKSQYDSILANNDNVVIQLTANQQASCKDISRVYNDLAQELFEANKSGASQKSKSSVILAHIDCSNGIPDFCDAGSVIPCFHFYYKGKELTHRVITGGAIGNRLKLINSIREL